MKKMAFDRKFSVSQKLGPTGKAISAYTLCLTSLLSHEMSWTQLYGANKILTSAVEVTLRRKLPNFTVLHENPE